MLRRDAAYLIIVRSHEVGCKIREVPVHEKKRRPLIPKLVEALQLRLTGGNQKYVDIAAEQSSDLLLLQLRTLFGRSQEQSHLRPTQCAGERLRELGEERVNQVGHNQSHCVSSSAGQAAGQHVRLIVELPHALQYTRAGLLANVLISPKDLRNCYRRDSQVPRDVFKANSQERSPLRS